MLVPYIGNLWIHVSMVIIESMNCMNPINTQNDQLMKIKNFIFAFYQLLKPLIQETVI